MLNLLEPIKRTESVLASKRAERKEKQSTTLVDEKNHAQKKRTWFRIFKREKTEDANIVKKLLIENENEQGLEVFDLQNDISGFDNFIIIQKNQKALKCLENVQNFTNKCNGFYALVENVRNQCDAIKKGENYKLLNKMETFQNFCKDIANLKENVLKFTKEYKQILDLKNKMICEKETSKQDNIIKTMNERVDLNIKRLKEMQKEFYPMVTSFQLQKNFYDILNTLTLNKPSTTKEQTSSFFEGFKAFFNFEQMDSKPELDVISSHKSLDFKNLTINKRYCNLKVENLKKLDEICGKIIDYSSEFKDDTVSEAREIIKEILKDNLDDQNSPECSISAYKAQKVMFVLNQLLLGSFDHVLPQAFELKQRLYDENEKKIVQQTLHKLDAIENRRSFFSFMRSKITPYSSKEKFEKLYLKEKTQEIQRKKFYNRISFDENSDLVLKASQECQSSDSGDFRISMTNVFGVNNNQFTQVGNMVSTGEVCYIMKNTIGPNFQAVLIGSTIETGCMNNIGTLNFKDVYKQ